MKIDDDLWPTVKQHGWKWQAGRTAIVGIIWHATRSGIPGRTPAQEYTSCLNWFASPNNRTVDPQGRIYGGMTHYCIGGGKVLRAVPEELVPRFSAGVHDFYAISVEVGQNLNSTPYHPRDIEICHELAADLSSRYGFKPGRLPFVDGNNSQWPGEVGHEDTAQGRGQGKSDPGPLFWQQYLKEGAMTPAELERMERLERLMGGNGIRRQKPDGTYETLTGEAALANLDERGLSLHLGLDLTQERVGKLEAGVE